MMTEDEIRPLLHTASAEVPPGIDLLQGVRHVRRTPRVLVPALASLGTAAAAGVAVLATVSIGGAPSAQAEVAAALEQTAGQSFTMHIVQDKGAVYDGASDPAHRVGWSKLADGSAEWRYIGRTTYAKKAGLQLPPGKQWIAETMPSEAEIAAMPPQVVLIKVAPDDPQTALRVLRSTVSVKKDGSASGAGWTGKRYTFQLPAKATEKMQAGAASGTIDVDTQGRVRRVTFTAGDSAKPSVGAGLSETMEFGDFGLAVHVTAPPADQVVPDDQAIRSGKGTVHKPAG